MQAVSKEKKEQSSTGKELPYSTRQMQAAVELSWTAVSPSKVTLPGLLTVD
ncbi:predicted protein [Sclerotinia sclerotiorum 1980 UF-70]|uniref:Uncharacterized protein n=1 Tax=Sclerotinia sclerotiorum (strain ATCC 18683 / 1980 / Ss-1) TaxID=665079 RepID=A7EFX9_SCLS1|nr:predicted protein [Sclerotinia sclerotiorum 1980 UF-70]EDO01745.1 predicted protein [Sclerotinia sclerotiorum 1980 UF-70]